ncbi:MAG: hypothetical protein B6244_06275 [Candidatus Cloacimonetes bacterium 4572_55]|nr:MAG: hypothetical protein B6244_06275 [Candidatus Cloacimonetes bacterium 4572_55]
MLNLLKSDEKTGLRNPVLKSSGTLSDIRYFFLNKPKIDTLIRFKTESDRQNYSQRILQRLGMKVTDYSILNIHQIGIQVPVRYVFEELLKWNGDSTCWPNYLAKVVRIEDRLENIQIFLFGRTKYPFGLKKGPFGLHFVPLFNLNAIKFQRLPDPHDFDNARYLQRRLSHWNFFYIYAVFYCGSGRNRPNPVILYSWV